MQARIWLRIEAFKQGRQWHCGKVSTYKNKPATDANEVAIAIDIDLPDALFERPQLTAKISVAQDSLGEVLAVAEVADNVGQMLSEQLGVQVHVSAEYPPSPK